MLYFKIIKHKIMVKKANRQSLQLAVVNPCCAAIDVMWLSVVGVIITILSGLYFSGKYKRFSTMFGKATAP